MSEARKSIASSKIYRDKPRPAFEAMQFTGTNAKEIMHFANNNGVAAFYRAPVRATVVTLNGQSTLKQGIAEAVGLLMDPERPTEVRWVDLNAWLCYYSHETAYRAGFFVADDEFFKEQYVEVD